MPTRPGFDVVPLRKPTKERLAALKGSGSYDEAIRALLDAAPAPAPAPRHRLRDPEEQVALAELAARRWKLAVEEGRIAEVGPRLLVYRTREPGARRGTRVEWSGRRGFAP